MRKKILCVSSRFKEISGLLCLCAGLFLSGTAFAFQGYNVVVTTDPATEATFLADTTAQFNATVTANDFFTGTYQINLLGPNPNFNGPPTTLQDALALGSTVYLYGFRDGMRYQQTQEESMVSQLINLCNSPGSWELVATTTATFNDATCQDVVETIENNLFEMSDSTPTPIPPEP